MEEKNKSLIVNREGLVVSILKDSFMMSLTLGSFWVNHKFIGDNFFLNSMLVFLLIGFEVKAFHFNKIYHVKEEKLKEIEKMIKEEK
jgi:hypothetical protein